MLAGWPAQLATSVFNQLGQYANNPGHRAYCNAELAVVLRAAIIPPLNQQLPPETSNSPYHGL